MTWLLLGDDSSIMVKLWVHKNMSRMEILLGEQFLLLIAINQLWPVQYYSTAVNKLDFLLSKCNLQATIMWQCTWTTTWSTRQSVAELIRPCVCEWKHHKSENLVSAPEADTANQAVHSSRVGHLVYQHCWNGKHAAVWWPAWGVCFLLLAWATLEAA